MFLKDLPFGIVWRAFLQDYHKELSLIIFLHNVPFRFSSRTFLQVVDGGWPPPTKFMLLWLDGGLASFQVFKIPKGNFSRKNHKENPEWQIIKEKPLLYIINQNIQGKSLKRFPKINAKLICLRKTLRENP